MGSRRRLISVVAIVAFVLIGQLPLRNSARAAILAERQCFSETNQCIDEPFLTYWREHGGLAINGYPITGTFSQSLTYGPTTVQYFERVRMELHPDPLTQRSNILLGQFGRLLYPSDPAMPRAGSAAPLPGAAYFQDTGHNLGGRFRLYWETKGGLTQFGYPLSEEFDETLEDGTPYTVQYFERTRLEYHPENAAPNDILLGQFGRRVLDAVNAPPLELPQSRYGGIQLLYGHDLGVRVRLRAPSGAVSNEQIAILPFERGAMIYRAATQTIYMLSADPNASVPVGSFRTFADTWSAGQDPGGGVAGPGVFYPRFGFGKIWREHEEIRQALGLALADTEILRQGVELVPFQGGLAVYVNDAPLRADYREGGNGAFLFYTTGRFELWLSRLIFAI